MNKQQKLTWKYFIIQKAKEIGIFLGIVLIVTIIPYLIGIFCQDRLNLSGDLILENWYIKTFFCWISGLIMILIVLILIAILIRIICFIKDWIESNWKQAKQRAKKEVNKNVKKYKRRK